MRESVIGSKSFTELDGELRFCRSPREGWIGPLGGQIAQRQPDQFSGGLIIREMPLVADTLAYTAMRSTVLGLVLRLACSSSGKSCPNCSLLMSLGYLFVRIPRCSQTQQKIVNTFSAIPVSRPPNRVPVMPYTVKTNTTMLAYPWRVLPYLFVRNLGTIIRYG